jgi:hypothetical protein
MPVAKKKRYQPAKLQPAQAAAVIGMAAMTAGGADPNLTDRLPVGKGRFNGVEDIGKACNGQEPLSLEGI